MQMRPTPNPNEAGLPLRKRSAEELDERLIDQAFGNIHLEYPEVTREQVAERLKLLRLAESKDVSDS
jgi:hypothetical protein